ncbi:unnamed protein product [Nyctereutes procyonoides]|uniref:acireductone dioxygenase (Fe(2+)-requiring) n=1 Tax=Nyctereutes procyonoides TaxID=34880 RepID=A0A811ZZ53_NYCPR|nr:unnamed protein product [Nyctereutes procyonoides]
MDVSASDPRWPHHAEPSHLISLEQLHWLRIKMFYEEHLHLYDEIWYILYQWICIFMEKGNMISLPNYVKAIGLFVGEPVCMVYNWPAEHCEARGKSSTWKFWHSVEMLLGPAHPLPLSMS